ncbi:MAG TPA: family 78 glycoside hydrolase catalytic domain [Acidimicrobiia bacterium]|nr:family 78 glycoside hydrolase catalytic domain [Acidimicrobiia bacterium]
MGRRAARKTGIGVGVAALTVVVVALGAAPAAARPAGATLGVPQGLTVDGLRSPIGLGLTDVQFGWHVNDPRPGAVQAAYRIVVTHRPLTGAAAAAPVWDSGEVPSSDQAFVPYGGPALAPDTLYEWTVQTWAAAGGPSALAPAATFETGLADQDWHADWIRRATNDVAEYDQYTYARKEFTLSASPIVRARVYVSVDQQYELSVNGAAAGKGEAYSYPDSQYYETLDVTRLLRPGAANAVGILSHWDGATKGHPAGTPGTIMQLSVQHADGSTEQVVTDGTWKVLKANWLPGTQRDLEGDVVDYVENVDGLHAPLGWDAPGYDDSAWQPAAVLGPAGTAPWTGLVSVRTRIVDQPVHAVSITRLSNGAVVADFGKVYAARPTVTFSHGVAGRRITMHAGYLLDANPSPGVPGQVSVTRGTQHTNLAYSYVERRGRQTFEPFDYLGFRYLQIDDPGETLTAGDVVALARHTAVPDEPAATFSSASATADAVFALGAHSALYTAQEQFVDTPTREKGPWLWDGFNESQTAMAAFGEQNLTRKSLLEFAQSQARYWPQGRINKIYPTGLGAEDINEFTEIYPEWVWQYWMNTDDRTLLAAVYPTIVNVSSYVAAAIDPATGLVANLPATNVYYPYPVVTRLNVLGANVFRRAAQIATALGRPAGEVTSQQTRQQDLTNAINAHLTRPDGVYADGLQANGTQVNQASQQTESAAIAYGVVPAGNAAKVGAYMASLGMQNPPRTAGELLEALHLAGRDRDVLTRITDARTPGWANILAQGGTFTWEVWKPLDANGDSMSHGWGSNVLVEIQHVLLGVTPTAPGYATFDVTRPGAGLTSASGRVPTPRGFVAVAWHGASASSASLTLTVPVNATATVNLRTSAGVTVNGRPPGHVAGVGPLTPGPDGATFTVGAGTYHIRAG